MGLIFPRWSLILPRIPTPTVTNPYSLLSSHTPFCDMYIHKTPQNTPFPGLNLKLGKMNYSLGNLDSKWAKNLGKTFLEVGKKKKLNIMNYV